MAEKQKVKFYNPNIGDFDYIKFEGDPLIFEKYRYISAQITMQRSRLERLKAAMLSGAMSSSYEIESKVNELSKRAEILASKSNLISTSIEELETAIAESKKRALSGELLQRYIAVREQILKVEQALGGLISIRTPDIFGSIMHDLENMNERIRKLEEIVGATVDIVLKDRLERAKRYIDYYDQEFAEKGVT
ncbi:MAG: hypothetical protein QXM75_01745 [Candidatus Diapherotrites archaeon]